MHAVCVGDRIVDLYSAIEWLIGERGIMTHHLGAAATALAQMVIVWYAKDG